MSAIFSRLSDTELVEDPSYRVICRLSLVAFIISLFSILAVVSPVLWIFPILAVTLGTAGIFRINSRASELSGKELAKWAILLALPICIFAPVRYFSRQETVFRQARVFADEFFAVLLEGKHREAFLLTVTIETRTGTLRELENPTPPPPGADPAVFAMQEETGNKAQEQQFRNWDLVSECIRGKTKPVISFLRNDSVTMGIDRMEHVTLFYRGMLNDEHSGKISRDFSVSLIRDYQKSAKTANWRFEGIRRL